MSEGVNEGASGGARVLLAEDEAHLGMILESFLTGRGHRVTRVHDGRAALDALRASTYDVALLDVVMPEMDGLAVLGALAELPLAPEAVVMTGNGTVDTALHALRPDAYDYLTKPYRMAEVDVLVRRAAEKRSLRIAAAGHAWERMRDPAPVPESEYPPLRESLASASRAARAGAPPLLVTGEPGTGRRTAARWLASLAAPGVPVMTVMCTGDERADMAALFGAEAGSEAERAGALGLAAGASLVVAEVHRLRERVAGALDDAIERGSSVRPGNSGSGGVPALVLATSADSWGACDASLAVRLASAGVLALPSLARRVIDITVLAERFLSAGGAPLRLSPDAAALLAARSWPGNVAELRCVLGAAAWHACGELLTADELRAVIGGQ